MVPAGDESDADRLQRLEGKSAAAGGVAALFPLARRALCNHRSRFEAGWRAAVLLFRSRRAPRRTQTGIQLGPAADLRDPARSKSAGSSTSAVVMVVTSPTIAYQPKLRSARFNEYSKVP